VQCVHARWISRKDGKDVDLQALQKERAGTIVVDVRGRPCATRVVKPPFVDRSPQA